MSSVVSTSSSSSTSSVSGKASSCLCAPTTHAGSFRCRLHRTQQSWGRRPLPSSDVDEMFASEVEASVKDVQQTTKQASVASSSSSTSPLPSPPARRTSPRSANRPRLSVTFAEEAQVSVGGQFHNVKMATGTGGSYASKRGARPDLFRMVKTGTTTTNIYL